MQPMHLCVLVHLLAGDGVGTIGLFWVLQWNVYIACSRAVLLLWIICFFVSYVSCAFLSVRCCLVVDCWERTDLLAFVCDFVVIFPCGIQGQVWYFIVSFPYLCCLSFIVVLHFNMNVGQKKDLLIFFVHMLSILIIQLVVCVVEITT